MSDDSQAPNLPMTIHAQYIKDLSFENPNAPHSMRSNQEPPTMGIDINLDAAKIESDKISDFYEVQMILKVTAERPQGIVFVTELTYAAAVSLQDVDEDKHHAMLLVQTPHYLFPFARFILSDTVQRSGFPPLLLNPVNFRQMYLQRFGKAPDDDVNEAVETPDTAA